MGERSFAPRCRRTEEDLERVGIASLGDRRKLMATRRTQVQYRAMQERLQELENENARFSKLLGAQAQELSQAASAKGDADSTRSTLQKIEAELAMERGNAMDLEKQIQRLQVELRFVCTLHWQPSLQ